MRDDTRSILEALSRAEGCLELDDLSGAVDCLARASGEAEWVQQVHSVEAPTEVEHLIGATQDAHAGAQAGDVEKAQQSIDRAIWNTGALDKALLGWER